MTDPAPDVERHVVVWQIPPRVWAVMLSWGISLLLLSGLFSFWIWYNDRQQDKAMCQLTDLITSGPAPVQGPAGDRARDVLAAMRYYQRTLHCNEQADR